MAVIQRAFAPKDRMNLVDRLSKLHSPKRWLQTHEDWLPPPLIFPLVISRGSWTSEERDAIGCTLGSLIPGFFRGGHQRQTHVTSHDRQSFAPWSRADPASPQILGGGFSRGAHPSRYQRQVPVPSLNGLHSQTPRLGCSVLASCPPSGECVHVLAQHAYGMPCRMMTPDHWPPVNESVLSRGRQREAVTREESS